VTCRNHVAYYLAPSEADCAAYKARTGQDRPSLAAMRLQDLTPEVASRHLALLLERGRRDGGGLRPRTVRGVRITLNTALASAYASGKLLRPVRVKRVAVPKRPPTVYSPEQTGSFLAVAAGDRLAAMWVLLVTSGMRPSEVLGLPWAAVDLEAGMVSIYQKLIKVENRAVIADGTKVDHTGAAVAQVIVLAPVTAAMLAAWRTAQLEERRLWPWRKDHNDLVFTKEDGAPLKPDWLNRRFKQLSRQAGLPDGVRVYDLRHGWATRGAAGRCPSQARARGHAAQQLLDHCRHLHPRDASTQRGGSRDGGRAVQKAIPARPSTARVLGKARTTCGPVAVIDDSSCVLALAASTKEPGRCAQAAPPRHNLGDGIHRRGHSHVGDGQAGGF
jgi:integrase